MSDDSSGDPFTTPYLAGFVNCWPTYGFAEVRVDYRNSMMVDLGLGEERLVEHRHVVRALPDCFGELLGVVQDVVVEFVR